LFDELADRFLCYFQPCYRRRRQAPPGRLRHTASRISVVVQY